MWCVFVHVGKCICVSLCVNLCMYLYRSVHVCTCLYMCVCLCVHDNWRFICRILSIVLIYSEKFRVFHYMAARLLTRKVSILWWRCQKLYHMFLNRNNFGVVLFLCPCHEIRQTYCTKIYLVSLWSSNIRNAQDWDKHLRFTPVSMSETWRKLYMNVYLLPH